MLNALLSEISDQWSKNISVKTLTVAIEGTCFAGKSTSIRRFQRDGSTTVSEYVEYLETQGFDFPDFPPKDSDHAKSIFLFWLNLEFLRYNNSQRYNNNQITLTDRSIFSLLAYEYSIIHETGIDIVDWAHNSAIKNAEKIQWPYHIVYIDIPVDIIMERNSFHELETGYITPKRFLSKTFNQAFKQYFQTLSQTYPERISFIDGSNDSNETYNLINNIIRNLHIS
jgi:thymidylate kinase